MKTCYRCKISKNESEFNKQVAQKDGLCPHCRECTRVARGYAGRPRRNKSGNAICHPDRPARAQRLCGVCYSVWSGRKPTVSMDEFITFMRTKPNKCEICSAEKELCMDHNHKTGKPRGFICRHCNTFLGSIEEYEDKGLLDKIMIYKNRNFIPSSCVQPYSSYTNIKNKP